MNRGIFKGRPGKMKTFEMQIKKLSKKKKKKKKKRNNRRKKALNNLKQSKAFLHLVDIWMWLRSSISVCLKLVDMAVEQTKYTWHISGKLPIHKLL